MILITGATGTVGKELVKLLARPEEPVPILLRDHAKAASVAYPGAEVAAGDLGFPETLDLAFAGIDKALLLAPPIENQLELETNFMAAAARKLPLDRLFLYPTTTRQGVPHYGLSYGLFPDQKSAAQALNALPATLQKDHPVLRTVGGIREEMGKQQ